MEGISLLSVDQYHRMITAGILIEGEPIELVEGLLLRKKRKTPPYCWTTTNAESLLRPRLQSGHFYTSIGAVTLRDGEPEPSGMLVRGTLNDYWKRHPGPADLALVVEVAEASLSTDRGIKLRSYARAGIPVYWIVNLIARQIEVHTDPDATAIPEPTYRNREVFTGDAAIPIPVANTTVPAAALLPPIG